MHTEHYQGCSCLECGVYCPQRHYVKALSCELSVRMLDSPASYTETYSVQAGMWQLKQENFDPQDKVGRDSSTLLHFITVLIWIAFFSI
jgi:hypothetical protein